MTLGDGDSIALAVELTPKAWADHNGEPCAGLDTVVTAHHVQRKRKAMKQPEQ